MTRGRAGAISVFEPNRIAEELDYLFWQRWLNWTGPLKRSDPTLVECRTNVRRTEASNAEPARVACGLDDGSLLYFCNNYSLDFYLNHIYVPTDENSRVQKGTVQPVSGLEAKTVTVMNASLWRKHVDERDKRVRRPFAEDLWKDSKQIIRKRDLPSQIAGKETWISEDEININDNMGVKLSNIQWEATVLLKFPSMHSMHIDVEKGNVFDARMQIYPECLGRLHRERGRGS